MAIVDTLIGNVKGKKGDAGEITAVTASVANNVGTPSCAVTLGGTPSERTINLAFSGLKGAKGDTGSVTTGGTTGDFDVAGDLNVQNDTTINGDTILGGDLKISSVHFDVGSLLNQKLFMPYDVQGTYQGINNNNSPVTLLIPYAYLYSSISNSAYPRLIVQPASSPAINPILIMDLIAIKTNEMIFGCTFPVISTNTIDVRHCYVVVNNQNVATFYAD